MKRTIGLAALASAAIFVGACSDSNDSTPVTPSQLALRVIHASPDAPDVNVLVNSDIVLPGVSYKEGSGYLGLDEGTYDIAVQAITPAGNPVVIDLPATVLAGDTDYSVLAIGKVRDASLTSLILSNPTSAIPAGQVRLRVVHASPDVDEVDVYLTAPTDDIAQATAIRLDFSEDSGPIEVGGGDYRVRITLAQDPDVVFDSGAIALPAGADLLVAAVTNTATGNQDGPVPVSLIVNTGSGQFEIFDAGTTADVRVGHLSPDAPAVDIVVDDNFGSPAVPGLSYPTVTGYLNLEPGDYNFKVVDSATQSLHAISLDATLAPATRTTVLAVNRLDVGLESLVLADDARSIATEARVRIIHGSPSAGPVDIYVTVPGADITGLDANFEGVPFKAETGYVALVAGNYEVSVTPANDPLTVAIFAPLSVENGDVITVIARDAPDSMGPLGVVVIDELD